MVRRLFTFASAASLLLCIFIAALWARSFFVWDEVAREYASPPRFNPSYDRRLNPPSKYVIDHYSMMIWDSFDGSVSLRWYVPKLVESDETGLRNRGWEWTASAPDRSGGKPSLWGWFSFSRVAPPTTFQLNVQVPDWVLCIGTAILPTIECLRLRRRRKSKAAGLCAYCGYDLRASKDRCPECGTMFPVSAERTHGESA